MKSIVIVEESRVLEADKSSNTLIFTVTKEQSYHDYRTGESEELQFDLPWSAPEYGTPVFLVNKFDAREFVMLADAAPGLYNLGADLVSAYLSDDGKTIFCRVRFFKNGTLPKDAPVLHVRFLTDFIQFRAIAKPKKGKK